MNGWAKLPAKQSKLDWTWKVAPFGMMTVTVETVELAEMVDRDGEKAVEVTDRELEGPEIVVVGEVVVLLVVVVVVLVLVLA